MTALRPSYRRVLALLARGYELEQTDAVRWPDSSYLDWGPATVVDSRGGPRPDTVRVSRPLFALFRERGWIGRVVRGGADGEAVWVITNAGREALT